MTSEFDRPTITLTCRLAKDSHHLSTVNCAEQMPCEAVLGNVVKKLGPLLC